MITEALNNLKNDYLVLKGRELEVEVDIGVRSKFSIIHLLKERSM